MEVVGDSGGVGPEDRLDRVGPAGSEQIAWFCLIMFLLGIFHKVAREAFLLFGFNKGRTRLPISFAIDL